MQSDPASAHDELVERVARALAEAFHGPLNADTTWWDFMAESRAALAVARPVIREECARVAESTTSYDDAVQKSAGCYTTGQRIAAAIRAME
jgi:hypothetical protein